MKKQYKLIKKYPGLSSDWEEGMEVGLGDYPGLGYAPCNINYTQNFLQHAEVQNNPEFWEEIKQEEYTILSIRRKEEELLGWVDEWTPEENYGLSLRTMLEIGECVNSDHFYINSIRRNSDGQIISVGDMCRPRKHKVRGIINKISIVGGKFLRFSSPYYFLGLEDIDKCKVLFTTRDGVDLYENDNYYTVLTGNVSSLNEVVNGPYVADVRCYVSYNIEYFSSKEKAQEFLDSLKPKVLFTTEDGTQIREGDTYYTVYITNSPLYKDWTTQKTPFTARGKSSDYVLDKRVKYFSTKESAEYYILMNKPSLSIIEVFDLLEDRVGNWKYSRTTSKVVETFKNHVKLKSC